MLALTAMRRGAFLGHLRQFIEETTRRVPEDDALESLFERGTRYGLVTEQQFAGYILLAWASGARRNTPDPSWIAEVMNDPHRTIESKVEAIFVNAGRKERRPN